MLLVCKLRTDKYDKRIEKFHVAYEEEGHVLDEQTERELHSSSQQAHRF